MIRSEIRKQGSFRFLFSVGPLARGALHTWCLPALFKPTHLVAHLPFTDIQQCISRANVRPQQTSQPPPLFLKQMDSEVNHAPLRFRQVQYRLASAIRPATFPFRVHVEEPTRICTRFTLSDRHSIISTTNISGMYEEASHGREMFRNLQNFQSSARQQPSKRPFNASVRACITFQTRCISECELSAG